MRKVIGIILAGWPIAALLILMLVAQYQNYGLKGAILMLVAMIVTGCCVWFGLNLAFAPKGR